MLAALDAQYDDAAGSAQVGCVLFHDWGDAAPAQEQIAHAADVAPYESGALYRRELPALLSALERLEAQPHTVIVDGYVDLAKGRPGLGRRLFETLGGAVTVIGVAKSRFAGNDVARPVRRGTSNRPLYITAAGLPLDDAATAIADMHGPARIPTLLQRADALARGRR